MILDDLIGRLADVIDDGVIITDASAPPGPVVVWCNSAFAHQTGYAVDEMIGRSPKLLQGPGTDAETVARMRSGLNAWSPIREQLLNYRKDGTPFWIDLSLRPIADASGWFRFWVGVQRDMTEQVRLKEELQSANALASEATQRLWSAIEAIPEAFVIFDHDDRVVAFNKRYRELYARSAPAIHVGASFTEILEFGMARGQFPAAQGQEAAWYHRMLELHRNPDGPIEQELPGKRFLKVHEVRTTNGDIVGFRTDVTEFKRQKQQLEANAYALARAKHDAELASNTDPLTGLGNRRALDARLRELSVLPEPGIEVSLLHIDLDHFKSINDAYGHPSGDHVLKHIARVLADCVMPGDLIARVGGDEFVIVLTAPDGKSDAENVSATIIERCREPIVFEDRLLHVGASIGTASGPPTDAPTLLRDADLALYQAKRAGRNQQAMFTPHLMAIAAEKKRIADEVLKAMADDRIVPFFQPQVTAETRTFVGVEALVRWSKDNNDFVPPSAFLPVAEDLGLMPEIDEIILSKSLDMARRSRQSGLPIPKVSVNVSYRRIVASNLLSELGHIETWPCRIAFELLETIDFDEMGEEFSWTLDNLRESGIEIEIDDFGSGRASITTLLKIRPERIKIDRQIVRAIESDKLRESPVLRAIGEMGKALGMNMTAEGVETESQARVLRQMGCDILQGHLISPALPETDLHGWIVNRPDLATFRPRSTG